MYREFEEIKKQQEILRKLKLSCDNFSPIEPAKDLADLCLDFVLNIKREKY